MTASGDEKDIVIAIGFHYFVICCVVFPAHACWFGLITVRAEITDAVGCHELQFNKLPLKAYTNTLENCAFYWDVERFCFNQVSAPILILMDVSSFENCSRKWQCWDIGWCWWESREATFSICPSVVVDITIFNTDFSCQPMSNL